MTIAGKIQMQPQCNSCKSDTVQLYATHIAKTVHVKLKQRQEDVTVTVAQYPPYQIKPTNCGQEINCRVYYKYYNMQ